MAKSKSYKNKHNNSGRVALANANTSVLPPISISPRSLLNLDLFPLADIEDRRYYNPQGAFAPARSFSKPRHRLKAIDRTPPTGDLFRKNRSQTRALIAFQAPQNVLVCVRRQRRKEVLHALNKAGKVGQRRPRRSFYSSISCRG